MQRDKRHPDLPIVETPVFPAKGSPQTPPLTPTSPITGQFTSAQSWQAQPQLSVQPHSVQPQLGQPQFGQPVQPQAAAAQSTTTLRSQPSIRRHQRKRSSTIYVQPRPAPPANQIEETPLASGLLRGVTTLAGAQLLAKLLSFILNQLLIKFLGARELGASSQLDLLVGTALALSRDALRLASQRQAATNLTHKSEYTTDGKAVLGTVVGDSQETVNLGWVAASLGAGVVSLISLVLFTQQTWPATAIAVAATAALVELSAEPCFLLIQKKLKLEQRAKTESVANTVRVVVVAISLLLVNASPFLGFAIGHLSYALTLATIYYIINCKYSREDGFSLRPKRVWTDQRQITTIYVSQPLWRASIELSIQQLARFFLTEGDKLAVGIMTALEEQGEYALAGNYGSLLARLVFLPVEETLRSYFTRVSPREPANRVDASSPAAVPGNEEGNSVQEPRKSPADVKVVLTSVLRVYTYLGILAAGFGPLVAGYIISFIVSQAKFSGAAEVLAAYACYIPVLAWNGVSESLIQSVASLQTLRTHGLVLAGIAVVFVVLTYLFVSVAKMGAVGIVWAQLIAMSIRTAWNLNFATKYFGKGYGWLRECAPHILVGITATICVTTARYFMGEVRNFQQFVFVGSLALPVLGTALASEKATILRLKDQLKTANSHGKLPAVKEKQE